MQLGVHPPEKNVIPRGVTVPDKSSPFFRQLSDGSLANSAVGQDSGKAILFRQGLLSLHPAKSFTKIPR